MSKTLHTHKVFFHKNVSQRPSQRYDFENNNRRNPGNEVAQINLWSFVTSAKTKEILFTLSCVSQQTLKKTEERINE